MKIIEIGTGYTPIPTKIGAATEIVIENLLREFNTLGIECVLFDVSFTKKNIKNDDSILGAKVIRVPLPEWLSQIKDFGFTHYIRRLVYSVKVAIKLKKKLKEQNNNIYIHFHNQFNYFIVYFLAKNEIRKSGAKTIYTVHSPEWLTVSRVPLKYKLEKFAIQKSDYVITLTELIKTKILKLIPTLSGNKLYPIPNGVDVEIYNALQEIKKEDVILNIGSICVRKGQLETIKNVYPFLVKYNFQFIFAGKIADVKYFNDIQNFISMNRATDKIKYLGEIVPGKNLNKIYNSAKFYLSDSQHEAFSLVILESMSSGTPVVLSSNFNKFLDKESELRKVIEISSPDKYIDFISSLIQGDNAKYNEYREEQLNLVRNKFSWNHIATTIIDTLNKI